MQPVAATKPPAAASPEPSRRAPSRTLTGRISAIIWPRRTRKAGACGFIPQKPQGRFYRGAHLAELAAAGGHVRRAVHPHQRQPAAHDQHRRAQVRHPRPDLLAAGHDHLRGGPADLLTGIIVFTAAFGRLWCGWTCPQTVLMEMVFRKIEYFIEGDAHQQRALDKAPWTAGKIRQEGRQARASSSACRSSSATRCWPTSSAPSSCSRSSPTTRRSTSRADGHDPVHAGVLRHLRPVPRAGLHVHLPLRPAPIHAARRKHASWSPTTTSAASSAARCIAASPSTSARPPARATASTATNAWWSAPPALTSATARRWNACIAPRASTPATTSWTRSGARAA